MKLGFVLPAIILLAMVLFCNNSIARPVDKNRAAKAVRGMLKSDKRPLRSRIGDKIGRSETFSDPNGELYHVVYLQPNGFVIVAADDAAEPIICICSGSEFSPGTDNPMGALVSRDMPQRIAQARKQERDIEKLPAEKRQPLSKIINIAKNKWQQLDYYDNQPALGGTPSVSDIRVAPLVQSKWNQDDVCGGLCYNYYTPNNWYCGCVATAMAQLMRYYQYPTTGIGVHSFPITVGGVSQNASTRGGDGSGGPYNWSLMPLEPSCGMTDSQRQAIGALCYDAGVAAKMDYAADGSGAYMDVAKYALIHTFFYSNAVNGYNGYSEIGPQLTTMMNPNLDAGYPVLLGIHDSGSSSGGHAIVADGYGYTSGTLYHHLNMGWGGYEDSWYNLPTIGAGGYSYNVVDTCIYNVFVTGTGEIISGRITEPNGSPIANVNVTATGPCGTYYDVTDSKGIYAFPKVTSGCSLTITPSKQPYTFTSRNVTAGSSADWSADSGNKWQIDFTGTFMPIAPPTAYNMDVNAMPAELKLITLSATDDGRPNPPGKLSYIIDTLPSFGKLIDPCNLNNAPLKQSDLPYTLLNNKNEVKYQALSCYLGPDGFTFKANDGGVPPDAGDSNTATVTVTVSTQRQTILWADFTGGLPAGWSIVDGYSDGKTWRFDNPKNRSSTWWTGQFAIIDSDYFGSSVTLDEQLVTSSLDCSNYESVILKFKHYFKYYSGSLQEKCDVDIRVNAGTWQNVARWQGATASGEINLDISAIANGQPNVQVRWHYYDANKEWYWGIDDVEISAMPIVNPPIGDFGTDCKVDFKDFSVLASAWLTSNGQPKYNSACDISQPANGQINYLDLSIFSTNWLLGTE
jgi:hypothetical protein